MIFVQMIFGDDDTGKSLHYSHLQKKGKSWSKSPCKCLARRSAFILRGERSIKEDISKGLTLISEELFTLAYGSKINTTPEKNCCCL